MIEGRGGTVALAAAIVAWTVTLLPLSAWAHLLPAGEGTLNVVGTRAYIVLSLPNAAFDNDEGHRPLDPGELRRRGEDLRAQVRAGVRMTSGDDVGELEQVLFNLPAGGGAHAHAGTPSADGHHGHRHQGDDLIVMIVASFERPPESLRLTLDLWPDAPSTVRVGGTISEGAQTLQSEPGVLSQRRPSHLFFATGQTVFSEAMAQRFAHMERDWDTIAFVAVLILLGGRIRRQARLLVAVVVSLGITVWLTRDAHLAEPLAWVTPAIVIGGCVLVLRHWRPSALEETAAICALSATHGLGLAASARSFGHRDELALARAAGDAVGATAVLVLIAVLFGAVSFAWRSRRPPHPHGPS